ncbi:MAG: hypothetical protein IJ106_08955 [Parasporobacterium sp.]|nr:hypothetical protein [Parasporobacterium sp.]
MMKKIVSLFVSSILLTAVINTAVSAYQVKGIEPGSNGTSPVTLTARSSSPDLAVPTNPDFLTVQELPAEGNAAYIVTVVDQNGKGVPGVMLQFCTDSVCELVQADENGSVRYEREPYDYEVHVLRAPEGYRFDPGEIFYTGLQPGELQIRIQKEEASSAG